MSDLKKEFIVVTVFAIIFTFLLSSSFFGPTVFDGADSAHSLCKDNNMKYSSEIIPLSGGHIYCLEVVNDKIVKHQIGWINQKAYFVEEGGCE